jgi:hypothetical protein
MEGREHSESVAPENDLQLNADFPVLLRKPMI